MKILRFPYQQSVKVHPDNRYPRTIPTFRSAVQQSPPQPHYSYKLIPLFCGLIKLLKFKTQFNGFIFH